MCVQGKGGQAVVSSLLFFGDVSGMRIEVKRRTAVYLHVLVTQRLRFPLIHRTAQRFCFATVTCECVTNAMKTRIGRTNTP